MTEELSEKLKFRMEHLIPRDLKTESPINKSAPLTSKNKVLGPWEISFPMSYGKVAAKCWGPEDGKPVLAIHGWVDNAATFDTLIPLLPANLRIIAVDIAGHGLSDHYPPDINYEFYQSILAIERITRELKWTRFSILGHSLGGCMGMLYASLYPAKVDKLVLIDIVRVETTRPESMGIRFRKTIGKLLKFEDAIKAGPEQPMSYETAVRKQIAGTFGSLDEKACDILFTRGLKKVDGGYVYTRDRRLMAAPLSFCPKEDHTILARDVTAEVLIIKFTEGPEFEPRELCMEHIEALRTNAKSVNYVEMPGLHHDHLTRPEKIASMISDFFNA